MHNAFIENLIIPVLCNIIYIKHQLRTYHKVVFCVNTNSELLSVCCILEMRICFIISIIGNVSTASRGISLITK